MGAIAGGVPAPDDFLGQLARWSAADRVARAAAERARTRSLEDQSAAAATWSGLLLDLAEAQAQVTIGLGPELKVTGRLVGTARDFIVVETRAPVMVRTDAISWIAPSSGTDAPARPGGRRRPPLEISLAGALDALAGERSPVVVRAGGQSLTGFLLACGEEVVTIRAEAGRKPVYVPVRAVTCVELR